MATSVELSAAVVVLAAEVRSVDPAAHVDAWAVYRLPPSTWALVNVVGATYSIVECLGATKRDALVKLECMAAGLALTHRSTTPTD
jgi:hypothetical protein